MIICHYSDTNKNFVFKDFGFDKLVLILQIGLGTTSQAMA